MRTAAATVVWRRDHLLLMTPAALAVELAVAGALLVLDGLVNLLLLAPPILIVALVAALAWWLKRSWKLALAVVVGLLFIINQGLWKETVETLVLVVAITACSSSTMSMPRPT